MNTSGTEIASARALILAFLSNSEDDATADFADQCLDALSKSDKLKYDQELSQSYGQIVECGHEFAKIYDFDDSEIIPLREKFEETEELTWSKFEQLMDETCGEKFDVKATSLFLAIINQIRVPADELDDLLDLAVWYASTRVISFVTVSGGWTNFYQLISEAGQPSVPPPVEAVTPDRPTRSLEELNASITMSQFERTIQNQEVEMGSMVVLSEKDQLLDSQKTLTNSTTTNESEEENESNVAERTSSISSSVFNDVEPSHSEVHSISSDRLSNSPVIVTPPGTGTPVFISSQPESIDLDNESNSSVDASLINELIENVGGNMASENSESTEENGFNIDRTDTVRTLKPTASIPIRQNSGATSFTDDFSPRFSAQEHSFADSQDGIMLRAQQEVNAEALSTRLKQEIPSESSSDEDEVPNEQPDWMLKEQLQNSTAFSHQNSEYMSKQTNYFLLAGAAVVGLAAVYLKNR